MIKDRIMDNGYISELVAKLESLGRLSYDERVDIAGEVADDLEAYSKDPSEAVTVFDDVMKNSKSIYGRVFMYSWIHWITEETGYIEKMLREVIDSSIDIKEKYFVHAQIGKLFFSHPNYDKTEAYDDLMFELHEQILNWYIERLDLPDKLIPSDERNRDFILVLTGQLLMIQHAPTQIAMDRCKILMKEMKKDILLINTAVVAPYEGIVPMIKISIGNYIDGYLEVENIDYEGVRIPYVQFEHHAPNLNELQNVVELVKENRPYQIVSIGSSFYDEILCKIIPVLRLSLWPSRLDVSHVQYRQIGRSLNDNDIKELKKRGLSEKSVISYFYTCFLQPGFMKYSRMELSLPENKKIMVCIGGRLNSEIDCVFLKMIKPFLEEGHCLLLLGPTDELDQKLSTVLDRAKKNVISPGMVEKPIEYLEHCFLYLNPKREGGGISAVEAMSEGVPPITLREGDVYVNTGEEFGVDNYEEMAKEIRRYLDDEEFYKMKSEAARDRARLMTDSVSAFTHVMNEFERRMLEEEKNSTWKEQTCY